MATDQKYLDQAGAQLNPQYNAQVEAMKNQLAQNQQALEQQKGSINQNYDLSVKNANLNNSLNKNTVSNSMLGRGLGNSSIAVSGLAEQDAKNARVQDGIERGRLSDLNNVDQNKSLLEQGHNNTLAQMEADKQDRIYALAMQLEDRDWDKNFKQQGLDLQKQAQAYEQQYKDAMLKMEQEKMKFDMGYKNNYLAMQKEAQQAEIGYKNSMLALQQQQHADNQAWKQKEWEAKQSEQDLYKDYINSFLNGNKTEVPSRNTYSGNNGVNGGVMDVPSKNSVSFKNEEKSFNDRLYQYGPIGAMGSYMFGK